MIIRDDSERGAPPLMAHQPPSTQVDVSVSHGWMMYVPGWIILLHAGLFITLGWFDSGQWHHPSPLQMLSLSVAHATLLPLAIAGETVPKNSPSAVKPNAPVAPMMDNDTLSPLRCSVHVYASLSEKRSIVLNGKAWSEGDSLLSNLVVGQIQQDVTILSFNGTTFTLAALDDWSGGKIDEEPKGE